MNDFSRRSIFKLRTRWWLTAPYATSRGRIARGRFEILLRKILRRPWRQVQRGRLERDRADRIVRTMVAPGFVDRQELDDLETDPSRPIDKLPQRLHIADPQIVLPAQREKRRQHPRDFLIGRQIHTTETSATD